MDYQSSQFPLLPAFAPLENVAAALLVTYFQTVGETR